MEIKAYLGLDQMSKVTEHILRDLQVYIANIYGIKVDVNTVELPLSEGEGEGIIPLVMVNDKIVACGEPPSISTLLDELFRSIELEYPKTLLGFPLFNEDLVSEDND